MAIRQEQKPGDKQMCEHEIENFPKVSNVHHLQKHSNNESATNQNALIAYASIQRAMDNNLTGEVGIAVHCTREHMRKPKGRASNQRLQQELYNRNQSDAVE